MRGSDERTGTLFSYVDLEDWVLAAHPLRTIVNEVLDGLNGEFATIYWDTGRPSIAPERLVQTLAAADVSHDPLWTAANGAARREAAVSMVCGAGHG
jgi:hypothetical protein